MKYYFYHGVPENMIGTKLVPLNEMESVDGKLKTEYSKKYKGREEIMQRRIPLLNCLWNDVVQFLPLHPKKIFEIQKSLGLISEIPDYSYYEIESSYFDPTKTAIYFKYAPGEENSETKWLKDVNLADIQEVPQATIDYYKSLVATGEMPFNYQFVPHVVHRGKIDISDCRIVSIK